MKLLSYKAFPNDQIRVGLYRDARVVDIAAYAFSLGYERAGSWKTLKSLLEDPSGLSVVRSLYEGMASKTQQVERYSVGADEIIYQPLISDAEKFLCVGKNYKKHLSELINAGLIKEQPAEPTAFIKLNSSLSGHKHKVNIPKTVKSLDYEPELVFVIGKPAVSVKKENAYEYVAGITILNDLTCRDTQKREVESGSRFWTAKNAPGFGPLGPCLVTLDEIKDPYSLTLTCHVNGQERMRVNTAEQIWQLPEILEHFTRLIPLMPGDLISTGSPAGVAVGQDNPELYYLKGGDIVDCSIEDVSLSLRTYIV